MPDMLVKLYNLPDANDDALRLRADGIDIRCAMAPEKSLVVQWVCEQFNEHWASECDVAFARNPIACLIAVETLQSPRSEVERDATSLRGFACYDATLKGFFGPTGVAPDARGLGIGKALLVAALHAMRASGYGYAIIGGVGPAEFYAKAVGATLIADSTPGVYRGMLRKH